jgi:DNA-binding PadR family transcriptional regulator
VKYWKYTKNIQSVGEIVPPYAQRRDYLDARDRKKSYKITREKLQWLADRVKILQELTQKICKQKIKSIAG